ncbi:cell division protein FtsL [Rhodoferax sp. TBRC 17198]|jgi:cell division protein FtsL|uniref:cell division protein FtsL n=1 Tax=Rhodoferax potami TaxID=3068338 RepID=UPI0028BEBDCA|nr:cell division protein FtsL [Rhodoferax sp. TBRC 17198]MDT7523305.1 cell division protein FtsL [Rhodoferax sp. TBRC 17198]
MIRINLVLLLAVVISALYLVGVQYESRRLFTELDKARADSRRLETEFGRLQVAKREQATSARVQQLARDKLQMRQVTPAITSYVTYTAPATKAAAEASVPTKGAE